MKKPLPVSILIVLVLCFFLISGNAGAEERGCAQFEKSLDRCEIEYDVKLRCEKGSLIMGGDVISTSHSVKTLEEHIKFDDDFEYKIENDRKYRYRILCKKKTPRGVWGSMKEVIEYQKQKTLGPLLSKKEDQMGYLVTRGGSKATSVQKPEGKSLEYQLLVLIPEIPLSIKNTDIRPCEFEIVDHTGEKKIRQSVASLETFYAYSEQIGMQVGKEYLLKRISGDGVEVARLVVAKDENTSAIVNVLSEIDADSSYTTDEKRTLKIRFLNRINDLYDQYKLQWLVDFLESAGPDHGPVTPAHAIPPASG